LSKLKLVCFFVSLVVIGASLFVELATLGMLGEFKPTAAVADDSAPGVGIRALILVDVILVYSIAIIAIDMAPSFRALSGRIQGIVTLILSIVIIIITIASIFAAISLLMLMLSLLMSPPFGTIAYFAIWGDFDKATARAILSLSMFLKIVGAGAMVFSNPSFLKNTGFMLLMISSLAATFVLGLLHAFPPSFLVSITDTIGAIVAGIIALIWGVRFLIGAIFAIIRAIRSVAPV